MFRRMQHGGWPVVERVATFDDPELAARLKGMGTWVEVVTNDEYCLEACARLRDQLGLVRRLPVDLGAWIDKVDMKTRLRAASIATPAVVALDPVPTEESAAAQVEQALGLPLVVKPRRGANNEGVAILATRQELASWFMSHRGSLGWEAESFVKGRLFHANAIVDRGTVTPVQVGAYTAPPLALSDGRTIGSLTLPREHPIAVAGRRFSRDLIRALGSDGSFVAHVEFGVDSDGEPIALDVTPRAPGARVSDISRIHDGIHLERANYLAQLGERVRSPRATGWLAGWLWNVDLRRIGELPPIRSRHRIWLENLGTQRVTAAMLIWGRNFGELVDDLAGVTGTRRLRDVLKS